MCISSASSLQLHDSVSYNERHNVIQITQDSKCTSAQDSNHPVRTSACRITSRRARRRRPGKNKQELLIASMQNVLHYNISQQPARYRIAPSRPVDCCKPAPNPRPQPHEMVPIVSDTSPDTCTKPSTSEGARPCQHGFGGCRVVPLHMPRNVRTSTDRSKQTEERRYTSHMVRCMLRFRLHLCQLAAAAALSASVNRLRLGGKSGARLPTNGTFFSGSLLIGRLCRSTSELCSRRDSQRCYQPFQQGALQ